MKELVKGTGRIERFIFFRALVWITVVTILILVFARQKGFLLLGLIPGAIISLIRASLMASLLDVALRLKPVRAGAATVAGFLFNQVGLILVLLLAVNINISFLTGFMIGTLTVHIVVFINSLTEGTGLSKNNFE